MLKFLNSKKALEMLTTQGILLIALIAILWFAKGDPVKAKALLEVAWPILVSIAGVGIVTVGAQGVADLKNK